MTTDRRTGSLTGSTHHFEEREIISRFIHLAMKMSRDGRAISDLNPFRDEDYALLNGIFEPPVTMGVVLNALDRISQFYMEGYSVLAEHAVAVAEAEKIKIAEIEVRYLYQSLPPDQHPTLEQVNNLYNSIAGPLH